MGIFWRGRVKIKKPFYSLVQRNTTNENLNGMSRGGEKRIDMDRS